MGFFSNLFSSKKSLKKEEGEIKMSASEAAPVAVNDYVKLGLERQMPEEEKDLISAIITAIAAGDMPNSEFHIKNITAIDEQKLAAVLSVSGMLAGDTAAKNSAFVLKSVKEV